MKIILIVITLMLTGCIVVPENDRYHVNRCEISSDHKILRVVDLAKETNSYYSIGGLILYPISGVVSGTYVAINNVYRLGEEKFVCG